MKLSGIIEQNEVLNHFWALVYYFEPKNGSIDKTNNENVETMVELKIISWNLRIFRFDLMSR